MKLSFSTPCCRFTVFCSAFAHVWRFTCLSHHWVFSISSVFAFSQSLAPIPAPFHFYGLSVDPAFNVTCLPSILTTSAAQLPADVLMTTPTVALLS
ncbi:hypothetical protein HETIRDRAFT_416250 [Heterobasidion irregulare TC 32-1]|uniref:Uncharacterized protein n=1 Tax=Heterobasidion irregulare (strain TC 32-1) TaxID=747525 RepID=W4KFR0_HETIT|nr:uncharacterized protein HETIRDRAFT_416250 [Heterobasidion irregulare TC 32-1]ETW84564.1 hypothetical protein HETIRDRAFT_416250 [Heterobasidion irregulare TC 32-1]